MNPSYSDCAFKLYLPKCTVFEDHLKIAYKFEYRKGNTEKLMFYKAIITDKVKQLHENTDGTNCFPLKYLPQQTTTQFYYMNGKKIFVNGALLKMIFLSDNGEKTEVLFQIVNSDQSKLLDVSKCRMSIEEKELYASEFLAWANKDLGNSEKEEQFSCTASNGDMTAHGVGIKAMDLPRLEKYRDALKVEKLFLKHEGEQEIIDGQQRITSLFLLLRAIYTKLQAADTKSKEALNFINQIEPAIWRTNKLTGEVDYSNILLESRVVNNEGNSILRDILKDGKTVEGAKDNYSKNYNKFLELYEKASQDNPLIIYEFIYSVLNQAILLPITADTQDTALTIFSTLNDRGLPLSDADIFKAKIYGQLPADKKSEFIDEWKELDDKADYAGESIQSLFYYYMFYLRAIEKDDKSTTPGLRKYYAGNGNKFTKLFDDELLGNLRKILNIWLVVNKKETVEGESWTENKDIQKILDALNSYPNEYWKYPVIVYYLQHSNAEEFEKNFLKFCRKLFADLLSVYLEIPTINAVKSAILKLDVSIIESAKPSFEFRTVDEHVLADRIKNPHRNAVRMILKILAYEEQDEVLPDKWEIEHILPQKWQANYFLNISDDIIKEKIEHIGNKIPFEKKLNIVAGNGYFGKKKKQYEESGITVTKNMSILDTDDWNLDNIAERDIRVSDALKAVLKRWNDEYVADPVVVDETSIPSAEELAMIEEFKKKVWI